MSKKDDALKLALEALELEDLACRYEKDPTPEHIAQAIAAIREALAEQPAQHSASVLEQNTSNSLETTNQEAQDEPVAWKHDCAALLTNDVELWIDRCPHCGKPRTSPQPAQQHIEHCIWARNGHQPCPHVQPAQPSKPLPEDYTALEQALTRLQKRYAELEGKASKPWVGLTDVEWMNIVNKDHAWFGQRPEEVAHEVAKLVEAKLREKNS